MSKGCTNTSETCRLANEKEACADPRVRCNIVANKGQTPHDIAQLDSFAKGPVGTAEYHTHIRVPAQYSLAGLGGTG